MRTGQAGDEPGTRPEAFLWAVAAREVVIPVLPPDEGLAGGLMAGCLMRLVDSAPGLLKLHLLLMLNIGAYQGDIADLRHDEVAWTNGTITRQRSKTKHRGDQTPTVTYRLWPCTFALLKEYRSDHPELALTTRAGKAWVEPEMKGQRFTRRDGIKSNFAHIQRWLKISKPLKSFRKTSASMPDGHGEFSRYAQFFLGHSGAQIDERRFDKAGFDHHVPKPIDVEELVGLIGQPLSHPE